MLNVMWKVYVAVFAIEMLIGFYLFSRFLKRLFAKRTRCIHGSPRLPGRGDMHTMQVSFFHLFSYASMALSPLDVNT
ncbi:hypothetical protein HNY73_012244 [Argiope bruennichi]|uniref:Uncharacterized protein n=1 Tax=Argiope bruennichi TaxID=94029 RepID=A0A8T0EZZ2_ARGBR|nr:hypothetical protein HNY73_012244 [Argiope bruennichi]